MPQEFTTVDLGRMDYVPCAAHQYELLEEIAAGKRSNTLLLVEHPPILTLGANFHAVNLLRTADEYAELGIQVLKTDRGGDVTYHGPGQLVIYPIFQMDLVDRDLHRWLRQLEETIIVALQDFDLTGQRLSINTGVWIGESKVAAIGIKVRRWVSMHGIALNCDNDLTPFGTIIPCGIHGHGVTSISHEIGRQTSINDAKPIVEKAFRQVFA